MWYAFVLGSPNFSSIIPSSKSTREFSPLANNTLELKLILYNNFASIFSPVIDTSSQSYCLQKSSLYSYGLRKDWCIVSSSCRDVANFHSFLKFILKSERSTFINLLFKRTLYGGLYHQNCSYLGIIIYLEAFKKHY